MKTAFTFLVYNDLSQPEVWQRFFEEAEWDNVSILCHAAKSKPETKWLLNGLIPTWVSTRWGGLGLVIAQIEMIRCALEDSDVQRIFLLSDSCIPIKKYKRIYEEVFKENKSWITICTQHIDRMFRINSIKKQHHRLHSQWCMLTRKHAEMLVRNNYLADFSKCIIPDEHYVGTVLCHLGEEKNISVRHQTLSNWKPVSQIQQTPHIYKDIKQSDINLFKKSSCLFARKFSNNSNIFNYIDEVWN